MRVGFYIEGGEQLAQNLSTLDARVRRNVIVTSVRRSQEAMRKAARANARALHRGSTPKTYAGGRKGQKQVSMAELLAQHIVIAPPKRQRPGSYSIHVQMRAGVVQFKHSSKKTGKTTYIPAAIEYGHGSDPASAARPFMRPAAEHTKNERMQRLAQELGSGILREAIRGRYR